MLTTSSSKLSPFVDQFSWVLSNAIEFAQLIKQTSQNYAYTRAYVRSKRFRVRSVTRLLGMGRPRRKSTRAANEFNFSCISMKRAILRGGCASIMENNANRPVGLAWIWLNYTDYAPDCVYHTPARDSVSFRRLCLSNSRRPSLRRAVIPGPTRDV